MKILCIGHSSWDVSVPIDEYPKENDKYRFNEKYSAGGGPAANAAYLLGKWGMDTSISSAIGSDDFGEKIKKEFQTANVNVDYLETNYEKETSFSMILVNKSNGSRTVFNAASDRPVLKKINYELIPDIILSDGNDYGATQSALNKYPKAISVIDAGRCTPEVLELCKYFKYIVCSKSFAEKATDMEIDFLESKTLVEVYNRLQDRFPIANIVITLEDKGALYQSNNQIKIMPGLKVETVDTTGSGDIFHGAFVYGLANNYDTEKCVTLANIAAGLSTTKMGARLSVPMLSEVIEYYESKIGAPLEPKKEEQPASEGVTEGATNPSAQQAPSTEETAQATTEAAVQPTVTATEPNGENVSS